MDYTGNSGATFQPIYLCSVRDKAEHGDNQTDCIYILHSYTLFKGLPVIHWQSILMEKKEKGKIMGAECFYNRANGKNAKEAFNKLCDIAIHNYGNDPYNGTISTCDMGRCTLSFEKYESGNAVKAMNHIKEMEYGRKWYADYVDLGYDEKWKQNFYIFYGWAAC